MIALEGDPDRYDYLSENRLFLISWCIWDYTEFAEVRVLSFLLVSDLQTFWILGCYEFRYFMLMQNDDVNEVGQF